MHPLAKKPAAFSTLLTAALDLLLPPRCAGTGEIVDRQGMVSPAFWNELSFIEKPFCVTCGTPFHFETPDGSLCAACMETEPDFDQARAAVVYNDASRRLVLNFKYGDRLQAVDTFLPWMTRVGAELIAQSDILVPVPLHARRLWQRRFNQSALLALALAKRCGKTCLPNALLRRRHTAPQKGLDRNARRRNVRNAFVLNPRADENVRGKNILLVDDVLTSGATLNECARVLKKSGAKKVFVLTIARVARGEF